MFTPLWRNLYVSYIWDNRNTKIGMSWSMWSSYPPTFEFFINGFSEFAEFSYKNICHNSKRANTCHPATSCVRDQDPTTVLARHMWETGSLIWAKFMLQWFISFPAFTKFSEFLFHLGKTPMRVIGVERMCCENVVISKLHSFSWNECYCIRTAFKQSISSIFLQTITYNWRFQVYSKYVLVTWLKPRRYSMRSYQHKLH